jgi:hypothetical protein
MYRIKVSGNFLVIINNTDQSEHARHPLKDSDYEPFDELTDNPLIRFTGINKSFGIKAGNKSEFRFNELLDDAGVAFTSFSVLSDLLDNNLGKSSPVGGANEYDDGRSGYSHTGAFAGKPLSNNYVWESGAGISYSQTDANNDLYKVLSLDRDVHLAVDNPYWSVPAPSGKTDIGLFQGANLPSGVDTLVDYSFDFDTAYPSSTGTGFEGSTGRIKLNDLNYGDQLRVRFDFNVIPQIANTTVEPALWYSNRDDSDNITFTFPLTTQPVFYGGGTVGNTYLNRVEISAWITSNEDINALTLPAIKADNPVIIQPLGILITILR